MNLEKIGVACHLHWAITQDQDAIACLSHAHGGEGVLNVTHQVFDRNTIATERRRMQHRLLTGMNRAHHGEILKAMAQLVDTHQIRPLFDSHVFPFTEVAAAYAHAASGQTIGKVILEQSRLSV